jgi:membrane protein implicated in regulation of membrane protease activity
MDWRQRIIVFTLALIIRVLVYLIWVGFGILVYIFCYDYTATSRHNAGIVTAVSVAALIIATESFFKKLRDRSKKSKPII